METASPPPALQQHHHPVILRSSAELAFFLLVPRVRSVFSESVKDVQLGNGGPPGQGASGWRAVTRVLRSCFAARSALEDTVADLANVFLPSDCRICGAPLVALGPVGVCEECVARVGAGTEQELTCTRCGDALGMESARFTAAMGVTECTMCRLAPPEFTRAVAFANYDNEMREMLHLLKFAGQRRVAEHILGERLAAAILKLRGHAADNLLVIPVPLFAAREQQRGFNQARLLAEAALQRLRRTAPAWKFTLRADILLRVKDTRALYRLDPAERRRSLQGAFQVAAAQKSALAGREVLLIDDIMTTGATARACARVLLRAGAAKVWVATAARAQPEASQTAQRQNYEVALWTASARTKVIEPDIGRRPSF